jgi:hypothetical protein
MLVNFLTIIKVSLRLKFIIFFYIIKIIFFIFYYYYITFFMHKFFLLYSEKVVYPFILF